MIGLIVVVCAAFGLTVSEAKTEIMCLRAKGVPESTAIFSVEAAGKVYNQTTNEFVYLGADVNHSAELSIEVDRCIRNARCSFRNSTPSNCTTDRALSSSSKSGCQEPRYSIQCCTAASRGARAHTTTTRCVEPKKDS